MSSKYAYTVAMSEEWWLDTLAMKYGGDFCRKVATRTETPPTEAEWAEYREAVDLLAKLKDNPYFYVGGYDAEVRIEEPRPKVHIEYAETEAEYAARVRTLNPDDYETVWERIYGALKKAREFEFALNSIHVPAQPEFTMPEYPPLHPVTIISTKETP